MHKIEREHREYAGNQGMWKRYRDLYAGGERFRHAASEYLLSRNREPETVYRERLSRAFYENYIGSNIDWFAATLFRREPVLTMEGENDAARRFFNRFIQDVDRRGTNFSQFFRDRIASAMVLGKSYITVDFPKTEQLPRTRAEEDAIGRSRAYLVSCDADELVNWSYAADGTADWMVLRSEVYRQEQLSDQDPPRTTRWVFYDRERYEIHERTTVEGTGEKSNIRLVDKGEHALAKQKRVPVFELKVSEGLWLMNKAATLQLEHFNKSNSLAWALTMGLFAMPVVYSDKEFKQTFGESYYLQLGKDDRFGWTEPEGHVYQLALDNLDRLKEEIYRVCYLMTQAGGPRGSGIAQSAMSKQRDFTATQEVLRAYGDTVKETMGQVLEAIAEAREDGLTIHVSGLDEFDIADFSNDLDDAKKLLELGIESETLRKQVFKKLSQKFLCDARQEIKDRIEAEIERATGQQHPG